MDAPSRIARAESPVRERDGNRYWLNGPWMQTPHSFALIFRGDNRERDELGETLYWSLILRSGENVKNGFERRLHPSIRELARIHDRTTPHLQ
jgi:hypothetical protein